MASNRMQAEATRLRAQEKFAKATKREKDALTEREKAFAAVISKTAGLRSLRLAKEAADKEAADKAASEKEASKKEASKKKAAKRAPANSTLQDSTDAVRGATPS